MVTVAFKPPGGGTTRLVTLSTNCAHVNTGACNPTPTTCHTVPASALATVTNRDLGDRRLTFWFPDTDAEFGPPGDGLTLSGPAAIAVTPAAAPLPCGLVTATCASLSGTLACIDALARDDGACGTGIGNDVFSHFTALPRPNNFTADCFREDPPCTAAATEVRAAQDTAGNLLMPVSWQGMLVADAGVPVPRLLRARIKSPLPLDLPDQVFLGSFSPEGGPLPPILEPQFDPTVADLDVVTLFGSVDAPYTILQLAKRHGTCSAGPNATRRCTRAADCPGGTCVTSCVDAPAVTCTTDGDCPSGRCGRLFDFTPLATIGGPIALPRFAPQFCQLPPNQSCTSNGDCSGVGNACVTYAFEAQNPVPLEGLAASELTRTFTVRESIDGVDRNGDGDVNDTVVTLRDRMSGMEQALGAPSGCGITGTPSGRAAVRVRQPPFSFPAVAVENDVVAFLESEGSTNSPTPPGLACDIDGDLDQADTILRVFRLGGGEVTPSPLRAVDASPLVNGQS
ncbi:MAG: hypothetical protein ACREQL_05165, partial [Candidatus Binatia bacterium]